MLPNSIHAYSLKPTKVHYGKTHLTAWASIEDCNPEACRIVSLCDYQKTTDPERPKRCGLQRQYMQAVSSMVHRCYQHQLQADETMLFKVGMHIMPLYKTLCKLKMDELSVVHPILVTHRGDHKAHPVFKEIRETIKMINMAWKDIGLRKPSEPIEPVKVPKGVAPGFEDALFEEEPEGEKKTKLDLGGE